VSFLHSLFFFYSGWKRGNLSDIKMFLMLVEWLDKFRNHCLIFNVSLVQRRFVNFLQWFAVIFVLQIFILFAWVWDILFGKRIWLTCWFFFNFFFFKKSYLKKMEKCMSCPSFCQQEKNTKVLCACDSRSKAWFLQLLLRFPSL